MGKCIIIGAGEFSHQFLEIEQADYVIAADGGFDYLKEQKIQPDLWLGDMDSTSEKILQNNNFQTSQDIEIIKLPRVKDDTDTLAAIKIGLEKGYTQFDLQGMLGGRMDHSLANIQCLTYLREHGARGILYGKDTILLELMEESILFSKKWKGTISVFAYSEETAIVTEIGLRYETSNASFTRGFPLGVSNEFMEKEATISVTKGSVLICILPEMNQENINWQNEFWRKPL